MRTRPRTSLSLATLLTTAISACAARGPGPVDPTGGAALAAGTAVAASPSAPPVAGSAPSGASSAAPPDGANPPEPSAHSSGDDDGGASPAAARRAERLEFATGVALTSAGALAALMGGVFLGRSGAFCHSYEDTCGSSIALPITGALWIGAGVVPLVLGVTILVPRVGAEPAPSPSADARPAARAQVFVGPAGVGARIPF